MESRQIAVYLIISGALLLLLKFISFLMSDMLIGLATILIASGGAILSMKYIKDSRESDKTNDS